MNKLLVIIITVFIFYSCGETEYQKQLKAEIYSVSLEISMDSAKYAKLEDELHTGMMNLDKSDPVLLKYILNEQKKLQQEMRVKQDKRDMLELELSKTK